MYKRQSHNLPITSIVGSRGDQRTWANVVKKESNKGNDDSQKSQGSGGSKLQPLNPSQRPYYTLDEARTPQTTLAGLHGSLRKARTEIRSLTAPPKSRNFPSSDKLKWNGEPSTFEAFQNDLEGTLLKVGCRYLLNEDFQEEPLDPSLEVIGRLGEVL